MDAALHAPADFHCIGGFVVSQHYGFARETADLDVLTLIPPESAQQETLISQFEAELEPYITGRTPAWNRNTLRMWVDACWPQ